MKVVFLAVLLAGCGSALQVNPKMPRAERAEAKLVKPAKCREAPPDPHRLRCSLMSLPVRCWKE